jgi:hypothetical protein
MLSLWLSLTLAAAPQKLAAPGFQCAGLEPSLCDIYLEHFVARVRDGGLAVTTKNDVAQVLGVERQRQLLGCTEESTSCLAELAGALGVLQLLSGTVGKTSSGYVSTLKIIRTDTGTIEWSATTRVDDERALFQFLEEQADRLTGRPATAPVVRWVPAMAGAGVAAVGGLLLGFALTNASVLQRHPVPRRLSDDEIQALATQGRLLQGVGWGLVAAGATGVLSSVLWALVASRPTVSAGVTWLPGGAALTLSGVLP